MLPFLDFLSPIIDKALSFIPDPQKKAEAQLALQREMDSANQALIAAQSASDKNQSDINLAETNITGSSWFKLFMAGWRPALGWTCVFSFFWTYVLAPQVIFWSAFFQHAFTPPTMDNAAMEKMLLGLLGLVGARTVEKIQGAQNNH